MSNFEIGMRFDAHFTNTTLAELETLPREVLQKRFEKTYSTLKGQLVINEFPTSQADTSHLKALLNEHHQKRDFTPDVIVLDYLNLMNSARVSANQGTYNTVKAVAEEVRGIAVQHNCIALSATQANRSGYNNSDIDLTNTSESIGLPATVDWMVALTRNEQLDELGQMMIKQLKSRYGNKNDHEKFCVGVDFDHHKMYDLNDPEADLVSQSFDTKNEERFKKFAGFNFSS